MIRQPYCCHAFLKIDGSVLQPDSDIQFDLNKIAQAIDLAILRTFLELKSSS
jgi:hypothetical protein